MAAEGGLSVARGFESKSVADQQESAQDKRKGSDPPVARRRTLELARVDVQRRLGHRVDRAAVSCRGDK